MFVDLEELAAPAAPIRAKVCIIGAGLAGHTLAQSLAAAGIQVALMEAGGRDPEDDQRAPTPAGRKTWALGVLVRRFDPEADPRARQGGLDPVGELQGLLHRDRSSPVVGEVVPLAEGTEAQVLEEVRDLRVGSALAIELQQQERLRHVGSSLNATGGA